MKIYLLMILISTIAMLSYLSNSTEAPSRSADSASG